MQRVRNNLQETPRNNGVQEESWLFHYCSILRRFVRSIVPELCQRLCFMNRNLNASIEQPTDSSAASNMRAERIRDPYASHSPLATRGMSRLGLCTFHFDAELHHGIFKLQ